MDRTTVRQSVLFGDLPKHLTLYVMDVNKVPKSIGFSKEKERKRKEAEKSRRKETEKPTAMRNIRLERRLENPGTVEILTRHLEGFRVYRHLKHNCPVECVTKSILFIAIAVFILYLPLGDLSSFCDHSTCGKKSSAYLATSNSNTDNHIAVCCMCDVYNMMVRGGRLATSAVELFVYILLDFLYEAKLQFYHLLEVLDRRDLCRSVCCRDDEDSNHNSVTEKRSCRCGKGKTCKYRS